MNSIAKAVGLGNLKGKKNRPKNEDIDLEIEEDGIEETEDAGSVEVEDVDEIDEVADEIADEAIEEAKDKAAQVVEEIVPAAPRKPANPAPKEDTMTVYSLDFFNTASKELYDALVNKLGVSTELHQAVLDLIAIYPDLRRDVVEQAKELDYQPPAWGWRYKALGCLKGKIFDSKKDAKEAAEDLMNLGGKKFSDLFIRAPYYIEDGKFGEKVPEDSRDYQIIMASEAPANAEA